MYYYYFFLLLWQTSSKLTNQQEHVDLSWLQLFFARNINNSASDQFTPDYNQYIIFTGFSLKPGLDSRLDWTLDFIVSNSSTKF